MGNGKKTFNPPRKAEASRASNSSIPARNLRNSDLGAVIFGCNNMTYEECMQKQLFGLPYGHKSYVLNVNDGLILFLFNFSDRTLHGIFEAVGYGQLNIDRHAWRDEEDIDTPFPAQVRMRPRQMCRPLSEDEFRPIITDNYYHSPTTKDNHYRPSLFRFELDHIQTGKLVKMFLSSPLAQAPKYAPPLPNTSNHNKTLGAVHNSGRKEMGISSNMEAKIVDAPSKNTMQTNAGPSASLQVHTNVTQSPRTWCSLFDTKKESCIPRISQHTDYKSFAVEGWSGETEGNTAAIPTTKLQPSDEWLGVNVGFAAIGLQPADEWPEETEGNAATIPTTELRHSDEWGENEGYDATGLQPADEWHEESEGDAAVSPTAESKQADDQLGETVGNAAELQKSTVHTNYPYLDGGEAQSRGIGLPTSDMQLSDIRALIVKLMNDAGYLKEHQMKQDFKNYCLQHELAQTQLEMLQLRKEYSKPDSSSCFLFEEEIFTPILDSDDYILVVGGNDGSSWLTDFSCYSPSRNIVKNLPPLTSVRTHTSATKMCGELYVLGGKHIDVWSDIVESYNPASNEWFRQPSLNQRKGNLASVSLQEKVYAIGGVNENGCLSDVEMLDMSFGKWIISQPMQHKRSDPAVANINGTIYAVGGYDGRNYMKSVERFDPREQKWALSGSMSSERGCHSVIALNEKIYALGGFSGSKMVSTTEVFDPRVGLWRKGELMNVGRGYFGAVALGEKIYVIGGVSEGNEILESIEYYKEGQGWEFSCSSVLGKRCFFSALTL